MSLARFKMQDQWSVYKTQLYFYILAMNNPTTKLRKWFHLQRIFLKAGRGGWGGGGGRGGERMRENENISVGSERKLGEWFEIKL